MPRCHCRDGGLRQLLNSSRSGCCRRREDRIPSFVITRKGFSLVVNNAFAGLGFLS